jgi:hypothetical protein
MPDSASCPSSSLDAVALQQLIANAALKVRAMHLSDIVIPERPEPCVVALETPPSALAKKAVALSKRLDRVRSLLDKVKGDARRFDEARCRESRSLNPARRLGRKNSDLQLARLFSRIEQALQVVRAETTSKNKSTPEVA